MIWSASFFGKSVTFVHVTSFRFQQAFWSFGALFSVFLAWITLEYLTWRWYLILSSIPLWIVTFLCWLVPESVRYHHAVGEYDAAVDQLEVVRQCNDSVLPRGTLAPPPNPEEVARRRGKWTDICLAPYRITSVLLYLILWVCVFGYFGISFISERYLFVEVDMV